jgi:hypothetical protein
MMMAIFMTIAVLSKDSVSDDFLDVPIAVLSKYSVSDDFLGVPMAVLSKDSVSDDFPDVPMEEVPDVPDVLEFTPKKLRDHAPTNGIWDES